MLLQVIFNIKKFGLIAMMKTANNLFLKISLKVIVFILIFMFLKLSSSKINET